ncbi:MAG TPA: FAD-dependent oxidoreductase [Pyrinomonadaceae bacterium]|nr:FAD-dependent oxidoreductase [Pyrinomonadaceae bacterium]
MKRREDANADASGQKKEWTRRRFLERVGQVGGAAALYETMTALGLINVPQAWAGPLQIPQGTGEGKSVLILGAGIGGLTAAYELTRAGYRCQILESQARAGGRNFTARRGTVVVEESEDEKGKKVVTSQECKFDEGLYMNMGPGRLPYHHRRALHYCQALGVQLEVYIMETMANLFQTDRAFKGAPQTRRAIANDTQGYVAELLAKAVSKNALNEELSAEDSDKLVCLLKVYGDLGQSDNPASDPCKLCGGTHPVCKTCNDNCLGCASCMKDCPICYQFSGTTRAGCKEPLTVRTACLPGNRLRLQELLRSEFWRYRFYQPSDYEWQPTLFQPVGGMDQIVEGFKRQVGHLIIYQSEVLDIKVQADGVGVIYRNKLTGDRCPIKADYCISNIPLPILKGISNNFSDEYKAAIQQARFAPTCKLGWQANDRFWESNKYQIYGGISYIDHPITQMWYPSSGYFTQKGTLTGVYNYDDNARAFGKMNLEERIRLAREGGSKLHEEFRNLRIVPSNLALSIAWQNIPAEGGGWAEWDADNTADTKAYNELLEPDGKRFFVVGDQVSTLPGWQEGAMMSAEHVVGQITGIIPLTVPDIQRAPHTRRLVQGRF